MRIVGAHSILYSRNAEADRAFLQGALGLPSVDVGGGWLIFGLPPAEVAVHPSEKNDVHELYLMCHDVADFAAKMSERGAACGPVQDMGWGLLTQLTLPGGGRLGVYEPRHARPKPMGAARAKKRSRPAANAKRKTPVRARRARSTRPARRRKRRA